MEVWTWVAGAGHRLRGEMAVVLRHQGLSLQVLFCWLTLAVSVVPLARAFKLNLKYLKIN